MLKTCKICGKQVEEQEIIPLSITYNIPNGNLYIALTTYCKECNEKIVLPTIREISDKLALGYKE